jgi:hypothetical protein
MAITQIHTMFLMYQSEATHLTKTFRITMCYTTTTLLLHQLLHFTISLFISTLISAEKKIDSDFLSWELQGCYTAFTGQYRKGDLGRHIKQKHQHWQGKRIKIHYDAIICHDNEDTHVDTMGGTYYALTCETGSLLIVRSTLVSISTSSHPTLCNHSHKLGHFSHPIQHSLITPCDCLPLRLSKVRTPFMRWIGAIELIDNRMNHDGLFGDGKRTIRRNGDPVV